MKYFDATQIKIKSTMSPEEEMVFRAEAEIRDRGYALMASRIHHSPLFLGTTIGLKYLDHPEISTIAGSEEEVFSLLHYLAEQVLERGRQFDEGTCGTAFFKELNFRRYSIEANRFEDFEDFDDLGMFDDAVGEERTYLLVSVPASRILPPKSLELVQVQVQAA